MSSMWRKLLGIFDKDPLFSGSIDESNAALDHLRFLLNAYLASLGRLPPPPPGGEIAQAEQALWTYEAEARKKVLTHITSAGPGHLVPGLVMLTTVIDIEKLIDDARQLRGIASARRKKLTFGELEDEVVDIEERTLKIFHDMRKALHGDDVEFSRDVIARYKTGLSAACDAAAGRLLSATDTGIDVTEAAASSLYIVTLKRIGMHSRNLVTHVASPYQRLGSRDGPILR